MNLFAKQQVHLFELFPGTELWVSDEGFKNLYYVRVNYGGEVLVRGGQFEALTKVHQVFCLEPVDQAQVTYPIGSPGIIREGHGCKITFDEGTSSVTIPKVRRIEFGYYERYGVSGNPHWDLMLSHLGRNIDDRNYMLDWIGNLLCMPNRRQEMLVLYGDQCCGKSLFHEALSLLPDTFPLFADNALRSLFNGEMVNARLCVLEEVPLRLRPAQRERLQRWVESPTLEIIRQFQEPLTQRNLSSWLLCTNQVVDFADHLPFAKAVKVDRLDYEIPKAVLLKHLAKEATAFARTVKARFESKNYEELRRRR